MLEVKKCGKTNYGYWVVGSLNYNGLQINDIFSVNKELSSGDRVKPQKITVFRTKNNIIRFKIDL